MTGFREFYRHFKFLQPLVFDFSAKFTKRPVKNEFFRSPTNFLRDQNFLTGIIILGRRDWTIKKVREMPLKVKCRRNDILQAYELRVSMPKAHGEDSYRAFVLNPGSL